jgi:hypothetical protein
MRSLRLRTHDLLDRRRETVLACALLPPANQSGVCQVVPCRVRVTVHAVDGIAPALRGGAMSIGGIACALASALLCTTGVAGAQTRVDVPADCGSEAELRAELARLLGRESAPRAMPERLQIARTADGGYALALELRGESRTLRDPDCRTLFKTAVVVAAATVDPQLLAQMPAASDTSQAPRGAAAVSPDAEAPADTDAAPGARDDAPAPPAAAEEEPAEEEPAADEPSLPWRASVALGAGAALALLPQVSPLFELSGTLARGALGVALGARYLTGAEKHLGSAGEYGVSIDGFGARVSALFDPADFARLQAGVALDRLAGRGLGTAVDDVSGSGLALAVVVEGSLIPVRWGNLQLSLAITGQYALVRPSFEITGRGEVYRPPVVGATGIVRLGWEFD